MLWEPYLSYYNGLFSPLLVQKFRCQKGRSLSVLYEQYETSYLFYVTVSFLCNIICYQISVFAFSLVTLSRATTLCHDHFGDIPRICIFSLCDVKVRNFPSLNSVPPGFLYLPSFALKGEPFRRFFMFYYL